MKVEMELQIKFNREVDLNKDYVVPGGYEMVMNGKVIQFDFNNNDFGVSKIDSSVCIFSLSELDYTAYPEFDNVTARDLQNITSITECFVYVGEPGESDLHVVSIEKIAFLLPFEEPGVIEISEEVIEEFNKTLSEESFQKTSRKVNTTERCE